MNNFNYGSVHGRILGLFRLEDMCDADFSRFLMKLFMTLIYNACYEIQIGALNRIKLMTVYLMTVELAIKHAFLNFKITVFSSKEKLERNSLKETSFSLCEK